MKKKILSIIIFCCILFPIGIYLCACDNKKDSSIIEDFDGYVANISNYQNLGIATLKSSKASGVGAKQILTIGFDSISSVCADHVSQQMVLTGIDEHGNVEAVEFEKNGKSERPKLNIAAFNQTSRYIIVTYTKQKHDKIYDTQFWDDEYSRTYFIDRKTNLTFRLDFTNYFTVGMYGYGIVGSDCENSVIITSGQSYYRVGVEGDVLVVKEIFRMNTLPSHSEIRLCDIYGNCIIKRTDSCYYVLTKDGQLITLNEKLDLVGGISRPGTTYRAVDGYIYHNGKRLNEEGAFEETDNVPAGYILPTEGLIYSTEYEDYYYVGLEFDSNRNYMWYYGKNAVKVVKTDTGYEFTEINLGTLHYDILHFGQYIYSKVNDNTISKVDIITGEREDIVLRENIFINSIEQLGYNIIKFKAIDNYLNVIIGTINDAGEVSYTYSEPDFVCHYIFPLKYDKKYNKNVS